MGGKNTFSNERYFSFEYKCVLEIGKCKSIQSTLISKKDYYYYILDHQEKAAIKNFYCVFPRAFEPNSFSKKEKKYHQKIIIVPLVIIPC